VILAVLFIFGAAIAALPAALTGVGEEAAVEGAAAKLKWFALFVTAFELAPTAETTTGGKKIEITGSEGKGFTAKALVYLKEVNGKTTKGEKVCGNFIIGRTYVVVAATTNTFELALREGDTGLEVTGEALKTTSKLVLLKEVSGGEYKRVEAKLAKVEPTATKPSIEWAATGAIKVKVPASTEVTYGGWFEGESSGKCAGVEPLENPEKFTGAGEYELTADKLPYISGTLVA
jgi:hypothetical protein